MFRPERSLTDEGKGVKESFERKIRIGCKMSVKMILTNFGNLLGKLL